MTDEGNTTFNTTEAGRNVHEEANISNLEDPELSEESIDTDEEAEENDREQNGMEEDEVDEDVEESTPLPPLTLPPRQTTQSDTTSQGPATRTTSAATAKQATIKASVLRRMQPQPTELSSDTIMVAHSPPSSPAQQSPTKKPRQIRTRLNARK